MTPSEHLIDTIQVVHPSTPGQYVQNMNFDFDRLGNLTYREDLNQPATPSESFLHDSLNRLTHINTVQVATYADNGNILTKAGISGSYAYSGINAGPHAVTLAGGLTYTYNANGSMTGRGGETVNWTPFNKVKEVWNGFDGSEFFFDTGHNRITQVITENDVLTRKKVYVGGGMEQDETWTGAAWATQETRIFIISPVGVVGVYTQDATMPSITSSNYLHKDHLGSVVKVTDDNVFGPATVAEYSYDAWGKPRNADTWADNLSEWPDYETDRGFTGHEMLAGVELVHMNGRIYDPILGRFLSADPFVQQDDNLQNYNRYSYVFNNPISATDPSGFFINFLLQAAVNLIVAIKSTAIVTAIIEFAVANPILAGGLFGSLIGGIQGGFQGAFLGFVSGAMSAGIAGGIGSAFAEGGALANISFKGLAKAMLHGVSQGAISEAFGGDFGSGFKGAFAASLVGGVLQKSKLMHKSIELRTLSAAIVGGTAAAVGGGKFWNGAATGAFVHLFNDEHALSKWHKDRQKVLVAGIPQGNRRLDHFDKTGKNLDGDKVGFSFEDHFNEFKTTLESEGVNTTGLQYRYVETPEQLNSLITQYDNVIIIAHGNGGRIGSTSRWQGYTFFGNPYYRETQYMQQSLFNNSIFSLTPNCSVWGCGGPGYYTTVPEILNRNKKSIVETLGK